MGTCVTNGGYVTQNNTYEINHYLTSDIDPD